MLRVNLNHHRKHPNWVKWIIVAIPCILLLVCLNGRYIVFFNRSINLNFSHPQSLLNTTLGGIVETTSPVPFRWVLNQESVAIRPLLFHAIDGLRVRIKLSVDAATEYIGFHVDQQASYSAATDILWSKPLNTLDWPNQSLGRFTMWRRPAAIAKPGDKKKIEKRLLTAAPDKSLDQLRQSTVLSDSVAVVGIDPFSFFVPGKYQPSSTPKSFSHTIRGSSVWYVYAAHEDLNLTFSRIDLNLQKGSHTLTISVRLADATPTAPNLYDRVYTVAKTNVKRGTASKPTSITVQLPRVSPGMYRIEIDTSSDTVIKNLTTTQQILGIQGQLTIADNLPAGGSFTAVNLVTNALNVSVMTKHPDTYQTVTIGTKRVKVRNTGSWYATNDVPNSTDISFPVGDLVLTTDGLMTPVGFTLPKRSPIALDQSDLPDLQAYDYVVAAYHPSNDKNIVFDQTYTFNSLALRGNRANFSIIAPGLRSSDYTIGVQRVEVMYVRGPFPWSKLWSRAKKLMGIHS